MAGEYSASPVEIAREAYEMGATRVEIRDWRVCEDDRTLHGGWLVAATYSNRWDGSDSKPDYYHRKAFADWWAPAEHRNDGMRTTETAAEKGIRLGPDAAAAALREFAALPDLAQRLQEAR